MLRRIWLFLSLSLFSASAVLAQTSGTISGHVSDTTGAVIPAVTITLTDTGTRCSTRSTISTSAGDYTFPDVQPGDYSLKLPMRALRSTTARNWNCRCSNRCSEFHAPGRSGDANCDRFGRSRSAPDCKTPPSAPWFLLRPSAQMPVNSRNYLNLMAISANANVMSPHPRPGWSREGGQRPRNETISVGGSRIMFNHYTIDGINNSDLDFNSYVVQPTIDAIQEMKVQTGVYPAQYGYNATQINVVTKSGSNNYHGTAGFYFLRNNYADANLGYNYYPTPSPGKALPYKYNDYGFVLTGPISIPHVFNAKNRLLLHGQRRMVFPNQNLEAGLLDLANAAVLGGNFSHYTYNHKRTRHSHLQSRHRERQWHRQDTVPGQCDSGQLHRSGILT